MTRTKKRLFAPAADRISNWTSALALLIGGLMVHQASAMDDALVVEETRSYSYVWDLVLHSGFSPDGMHLAMIQSDFNDIEVFRDGESIGTHADADQAAPMTFSRDASRLGYVAGNGRDWYAVIDKEAGPGFKRVRGITFSESGERYAYFGETPNGWKVVADGEVLLGTYRMVAAGGPQFSPKTERLFYATSDGNAWSCYEEDREVGRYQNFGPISFDPDGETFAYQARSLDGERVIVVDGEIIDEVSFGAVRPVVGEGGNVAYIASDDGEEWEVRVNGQGSPKFRLVGQPAFTGRSVVYVAKAGESFDLVIDGVEQGHPVDNFWWPDNETVAPAPVFSLDGERFAFAGYRGDSLFVITNDEEFGPFGNIDTPQFGPNGDLVFFAQEHDGHLWSVVRDGVVGPASSTDAAYLLFSSDGEHLAYAVADEEEKMQVVIDDRMTAAYDSIFGMRFVEDTLEFIGVRDERDFFGKSSVYLCRIDLDQLQ